MTTYYHVWNSMPIIWDPWYKCETQIENNFDLDPKSYLKVTQHYSAGMGINFNILNKLLSRMEQCASNLESMVEGRTAERK